MKLRDVVHEIAQYAGANHLHDRIDEAFEELSDQGQKQPVAAATHQVDSVPPAPEPDVPEGFEEVPGIPGQFRRRTD